MSSMSNTYDKKLDRILDGKPELANTLEKVKREATRRAVANKKDHLVCMDKDGKLFVRVLEDYDSEKRRLKALVFCFATGRRRNIKQK